jgi:6-phosphogluconate dehydrogenase
MQIGMIGLGRMGANMAQRLMNDGHECVVFDINAEAVANLAAQGAMVAPVPFLPRNFIFLPSA